MATQLGCFRIGSRCGSFSEQVYCILLFCATICYWRAGAALDSSLLHQDSFHERSVVDIAPSGSVLSGTSSVHQLATGSGDSLGVDFADEVGRRVLLINGSADDSFTLSFYPEDGLTIDDYDIEMESTNGDVLDKSTDVNLMIAKSGIANNVTADLFFHRFPGKTNLSIAFVRRNDTTLYDSLYLEYLASGIGFYQTNVAGQRTLVSGTNRSLIIEDYRNILADHHLELGVFVQFLNGSDSDAPLASQPVEGGTSFDISSLTPVIFGYGGQIDWDSDACRLDAGEWKDNALILQDGCGMSLVMGVTDEGYDGIHFGYDFEEYRAGNLDVLFQWERFTEVAAEFEDELYMNYLKTEIVGKPPAVVRYISPANEYPVDGGTTMYVELFNAENASFSTFSVKGVTEPFPVVEGSFKEHSGVSGYYESVEFTTTPGSGKLLTWSIQAKRDTGENDTVTGLPKRENIQIVDKTGFLFSYDNAEVAIVQMNPGNAAEEGGVLQTLEGSFSGFLLSNPDHQILFDNMPIDKGLIQSVNETHITFLAPSRAEAGVTWSYNVQVVIGTDISNSVTMRYVSSDLPVDGNVFGASFDEETGNYKVGACSNITLLGRAPGIASDANQSWSVLDPSGADLLDFPNASAIVRNSSALTLPVEFLPEIGQTYIANFSTWDGLSSGFMTSPIERIAGMVIGVTIIDPSNRTVSKPEVSLRVVAKIEVPSCWEGTDELAYEWSFENKTESVGNAIRMGLAAPSVHSLDVKPSYNQYVYIPGQENNVNDTVAGPARLGQEFTVPLPQISEGLHRIQLRVYNPERNTNGSSSGSVRTIDSNSKLNAGFAKSVISVTKTDLVARIGTGEIERSVADAADLTLNASGSYDPDVLSRTQSEGASHEGLSFAWSCAISNGTTLVSSTECGQGLLPSKSKDMGTFVVSKAALLEAGSRYPTSQLQYSLNYTVTVSKDTRVAAMSQVVKVQIGLGVVAKYSSIRLTNAGGEAIDPDDVKYWEQLIITPEIPNELDYVQSTLWSFEILKPTSSAEQRRLFDLDSIISEPGYYTPDISSQNEFQATPLGFKAGVLAPRQEYVLLVRIIYQGLQFSAETDVKIHFTTKPRPQLIFPSLPTSVVPFEETIRATASVDANNDAEYKYQFYLIDTSGEVDEYCVDGCTGAKEVRFQLLRPGIYKLQARLIAANGKTVLQVAENAAVINTTTTETSISGVSAQSVGRGAADHDAQMTKDFKWGNDGLFHQRIFYVTAALQDGDESVVSMSSSQTDEECAKYLKKWVSQTAQVVGNELPITSNIRNYIYLSANYAHLKCIEEDVTIFSDVMDIVEHALTRSPSENTLQMEAYSVEMPDVDVVSGLQKFYNYTITRFLNTMAGHSTRVKLKPVPNQVNNVLIDLFEKWREHVTMIATSDQVCGWSRVITTEIPKGLSEYSLVQHSADHTPPLGLNRITVAVRCNRENGMSLEGVHARFEWCDREYLEAVETRKLVLLSETADYVYLSGIQGENRTETKRLVTVDITKLGESNYLVSAMADESAVLAQASADDSSACYTVGMAMQESASKKLSQQQAVLLSRSQKLPAGNKTQAGTARQLVASNFTGGVVTATSDSTEACSKFHAYSMWPLKTYRKNYRKQFEQNAYLGRSDGVYAVNDPQQSNNSYVTIKSSHVGLFGAKVYTGSECNQNFLSLDDLSGNIASLAGLLIGILLLTVLLTGLTYMLATTLFLVGAVPDEDLAVLAENYVERDFFGRGQVRLNVNQMDHMGSESESEGGDLAGGDVLADTPYDNDLLEFSDPMAAGVPEDMVGRDSDDGPELEQRPSGG